MSVQVSYKKQFTIGILFLIIILGSLEFVFRVYELLTPRCDLIESDSLKDLDYFQIWQICLDSTMLLYYEEPILLIRPNQDLPTIHINDFGFRGPEISKDKPESTYRIFLVGGSTAFGSGATSDDKTISGFLQNEFDNSKSVTSKVEVINAGISLGWSFTETFYIKNTILDFQPDLIIAYDGWNDANVRVFGDDYALNPQLKEIPEGINSYFKFKNFPFYRTPFVMYDIFFTERSTSDPLLNQTKSPVPLLNQTKTGIEKYIYQDILVSNWKDRWLEICEIDKTNSISTLIVIQPYLGSGNKVLTEYEKKSSPKTEFALQNHEIFDEFVKSLPELEQVCDRTSDLRNAFDNVSGTIYSDDVHVNDTGNKIIAKKIFDLSLPIVMNFEK